MNANEAIVDPGATVAVRFPMSVAPNWRRELSYILNAQVELRKDQTNASAVSFHTSLDRFNAGYTAAP